MSSNTERLNGRVAIAVGLIVLNLGLLMLNLDKHRLLPFLSDEPSTEASETAEADLGQDGTTETTTGTETSDPSQEIASEATTTTIDDWPGGHGPAPEGPPEARVAVVQPDGRIELTGSVPNWDTAQKMVSYAGSNLPGGTDAVTNSLTWHPDASTDTQSGIVVMSQAAVFGVGANEIDPSYHERLNLAATILKNRPTEFLVVIGHTDDTGEEETNAQLALDRASAVVAYLESQGVLPSQMVVASAGEDDPFTSNDTEEGRNENRRIELRFENFLVPPPNFG